MQLSLLRLVRIRAYLWAHYTNTARGGKAAAGKDVSFVLGVERKLASGVPAAAPIRKELRGTKRNKHSWTEIRIVNGA